MFQQSVTVSFNYEVVMKSKSSRCWARLHKLKLSSPCAQILQAYCEQYCYHHYNSACCAFWQGEYSLRRCTGPWDFVTFLLRYRFLMYIKQMLNKQWTNEFQLPVLCIGWLAARNTHFVMFLSVYLVIECDHCSRVAVKWQFMVSINHDLTVTFYEVYSGICVYLD
jgi:hypothetical protein